MFVSPEQCRDFREWLKRETEATEQWVKKAWSAVWEDAGEHEDTLLQRTLTVYQAEAILESMKEVQKALAAFENKEAKFGSGSENSPNI